MAMANRALELHVGTEWVGKGELWLDPLGDDVTRYECTLRVEREAVRYTWQYEGKTHEGAFVLGDASARWSDSWHQPSAVECAVVGDAWGLLALHSTYEAPGGPPWGWRTVLSERPTGELVLQMTNIAPWGEEARAVRMVLAKKA
jgi:hypothetical protein